MLSDQWTLPIKLFSRTMIVVIFMLSFLIPPAQVSANAGLALSFDGNNDYVVVDNTNTVMGGTSWKDTMSFSLWVKPNGSGFCSSNDVAACDAILGDRPRWWGLSHGVVNGQARLWAWNYDGNMDIIAIPYTENEWVHIAWVHSGGILRAYKNGILAGSVTSGTTVQPSTGAMPVLHIGGIINTVDRNWSSHSLIDEVRLYTAELSQSSIQATMFSELSGPEANLRAYYKMSDGSGTVLSDYSGNGFHGTLQDGGGIVAADGQYPLWVTSTAFDKPLASDLTFSTNEDTPAAVELLGRGMPGSTLTYTVSDPPHGTISGSGSIRTYTPDPNYFGPDSFTYQVWDGPNGSAPATVTVTVNSVNDAPVASGQNLQLNEDSSINGVLSATDADGDPLTYIIVSQPAHGTLSGSLPNFTYTPFANYFGPDSFTFKANDTHTDSNTATVNLTVQPVNDVPVADNKIINTIVGTAVGITLTGSDVENSPLTFTVASNPSHGVLSGTPPNLTYTPNAGYSGSDSFTYTASDSQAVSPPATVSIQISSGNQAPQANGQSVSTNEDTSLPLTLTGSDPEGQPLTFTILTQPAFGTLSGTAPSVTYHPNPNYNGPDSFTFKVNDGTSDSNIATISITVIPVNDAPVALNLNINTQINQAVNVQLQATDVDNNPLTYSVLTNPQHGTLSGTAPNLTYTPATNYSGADSFTYRASDGSSNSNTATVSISVASANQQPLANAQEIFVNEDSSVGFTLSGSDPEGAPITYSFFMPPQHGSLQGTPPNMTYTPHTNYHGADSFLFRVHDGVQFSEPAAVSVTVYPVNDLPLAIHQPNVQVNANSFKDIQLTGSDVDGDILSFGISAPPQFGTLGAINPVTNIVRYTPNPGYSGPDFFRFYAHDGIGQSTNLGTVNIVVLGGSGVNLPPNAVADTYTAFLNTPLIVTVPGVLANDSDPNGDSITAVLQTNVSHGAPITLNPNGSFTYTPNSGFLGTDTFTYLAHDGTAPSSTVTVTIQVVTANKIFLPLLMR